MVEWHHWLNGHEFEQAPAAGNGQGSLACCGSRGRRESDTAERRTTRVTRVQLVRNFATRPTTWLNYDTKGKYTNVLWIHSFPIFKNTVFYCDLIWQKYKRRLSGYSPQSRRESDTTEVTEHTASLLRQCTGRRCSHWFNHRKLIIYRSANF